jgi:hypothetical protein
MDISKNGQTFKPLILNKNVEIWKKTDFTKRVPVTGQ